MYIRVAPKTGMVSEGEGFSWPQPPLAGLVETEKTGEVWPVKPLLERGRISELTM